MALGADTFLSTFTFILALNVAGIFFFIDFLAPLHAADDFSTAADDFSALLVLLLLLYFFLFISVGLAVGLTPKEPKENKKSINQNKESLFAMNSYCPQISRESIVIENYLMANQMLC